MLDNILQLIHVIVEMIPFLLFGFFCAGLLHVFVPTIFYRNYLSQNNFRSILLATLFGIPLPLCSCGVLPTAMSLRREGASKGATTAFLTATPQTGIDSILATFSVFGLAFTIVRPVAALVTALFAGSLVSIFDKNDKNNTHECEDASCTCHTHTSSNNKLKELLRYSFVSMLQDIGPQLLIGMLVAACIAIFVPDSFLLLFANSPLLEMLLIVVIAVPMYVCATGSIPIAAALMMKGLSPGAALVFLMAGPAVSFASMMVVQKVMGMKTMLLYVASIIIGACTFGYCIDVFAPQEWFHVQTMNISCCHTAIPMWENIVALAFLLLIINALLLKYRKQNVENMEKITIYKVGGMSCNHCKMSVETNLQKLTSVTKVSVDLSRGVAMVEGTATEQEVKEVVESLGFTYEGMVKE